MHSCLQEHPGIFVPDCKETRYFDENYDKPIDHYLDYFASATSSDILGEVATKYLSRRRVPSRIYNYFPNLRLIVNLRNPIERAFSAYKLDIFNNHHSLSFEKAIKQYRGEYIQRGFYYSQLQRYFEFFERQQFLFLIFDDLKKDNESFYAEILNFLGVEVMLPPQATSKKNQAHVYPSYLHKPVNLCRRVVNNCQVTRRLKQRLLRTSLATSTLTKLSSSAEELEQQMKPKTYRCLLELYKEEVQKLSGVVGRDLVRLWNFDRS